MFIGIDVGGTYTDAVLTDGKKVIRKYKTPTRHGELLSSLLTALDYIIEGIKGSDIDRVVLSTTIITNIIAEKKYPPVALLLEPGPGLSYNEYDFKTLTRFVSGAIDYRGREITPLNKKEVIKAGRDIASLGFNHIAVVSKFSNRNNSHELAIKNLLENEYSTLQIEMGHTVSGKLNFPRRIATTMLTAATKDVFKAFIENVIKALKERDISAPAFILKADGGTLPLDTAIDRPVETIFSGPAASTLGAMSLSPKGTTSVVVDIGGTTTDLALILSGIPLPASKGAKVEEYLTHIGAFAVKSVPLGGDSCVVVKQHLEILPERKGPAYCLGGEYPTPTDALRYLDKINIGNKEKATEIIEALALKLGKSPTEAANEIVFRASEIIIDSINEMFESWEQEPAYRIWELMQKTKIRPSNIVGVGGLAAGLIPQVAENLNCKAIIPEHAEVANAIGAAVAQPTVTVNIRIDTERGIYTVVEDGSTGAVPVGRTFKEEDAIKLAKDMLFNFAEKLNIKQYIKKLEVVHSETFNMVRGWTTTGKIYDICVQTPRDILFYLGQGES